MVVDDARLLVQRKVYEDGQVRFTLPGGAPNLGEALVEGLRRECQEEIGCDVVVHALVAVADYLKPRDTTPPTYRHQVEFVFRCEAPQGYLPHNGPHPDKHQASVEWLSLDALDDVSFRPAGLRARLKELATSPADDTRRVYLGLID